MFKKALGIDIPLTFIGDMPRQLISSNEWRVLKIDIETAKCGDILFVRHKHNRKLLSHVAIVLELDQIFHCSLHFGTAVIQSWDEFFSSYEQRLNFKKMVRYIDTRNIELRHEQNGVYISD